MFYQNIISNKFNLKLSTTLSSYIDINNGVLVRFSNLSFHQTQKRKGKRISLGEGMGAIDIKEKFWVILPKCNFVMQQKCFQ
jgi:hypothetical protein